MALNIYESEDFDILEGYFLKAVEASLAKLADRPLAKLEVITSSGAVTDVLTKRLARTYGIAPGVKFDYLAGWFWRLMHEVEPDKIGEKGFDEGVLVWEVLKYLEDASFVSRHPSLAKALESLSPVVVFNLAGRIARVFANYNAYRNDWVLAWIEGRDPKPGDASRLAAHPDYAWQKALWKKIGEDFGFEGAHPSELIDRRPERFAGMPDLHVFVPVSVPPLYLEFLAKLSAVRDVFLYVMNPCRAYWFDFDRKAVAEEAAHPLLANWARQTKALNGILFDFASSLPQDRLAFSRTTNLRGDAPFGAQSPSNLELLKHSVFTGETSWLEGLKAPFADKARAPFDRSLEIHGAYSIKREVEVLVDYLYDLFASDETLKASDVLVLTPDIDKAAPVFDAVFGNLPERRRIAWNIVGRRFARTNEVFESLTLLLKIVTQGYRVGDLYAFVASAPVARHFGLDDEKLLKVRAILEQTGFHSGLDGRQLASQGFVNGDRFTLETAVRRLAYRYAMPDDFQGVLDGIAAEGDCPEKELLALAGFVLEKLLALEALSGKSMTVSDWVQKWLWPALDTWVDSLDTTDDRLEIAAWVQALTGSVEQAQARNLEVSFEVFMQALSEAAQKGARGARPTPGVCVTRLGGMRLVPYRVVAVVGLNEGVFPRSDIRETFDLSAVVRRAGDRQKTDDDRNEFFDTILAARDNLFLSFTSRSMVTGALKRPSGLLSELVALFTKKTGQVWTDWCLEHPIHSFTQENFITNGQEHLPARQALIKTFDAELADMLSHPERRRAKAIELANDPEEVIELEALERFWKNPLAFFWKERLKLREPEEFNALNDAEPYAMEGLEAWKLRRELVEALQSAAGEISGDVAKPLPDMASVPSGALGRAIIEQEVARARNLYRVHPEVFAVQREYAVDERLQVGGGTYRLVGKITANEGEALLRAKASNLHWEDVLVLWLQGALLGRERVKIVSSVGGDEGFREKTKTTFWEDDGLRGVDRRGLLVKLAEPYVRSLRTPVFYDPGMALYVALGFDENKRARCTAERKRRLGKYGQHLRALAPELSVEEFLETVQERSWSYGKELADIFFPGKASDER